MSFHAADLRSRDFSLVTSAAIIRGLVAHQCFWPFWRLWGISSHHRFDKISLKTLIKCFLQRF